MRVSRQLVIAITIGLTTVLTISEALAAPQCKTLNCFDTYYYENASMTKVVGVQSNCPGRKGLQGRRTKWVEREKDSYKICASTPEKIPCEFRANGCKNLPDRR
jgi:hypothetical protein